MNNENLPQKRAKENIFLKIKKWFKSMLNIKGNVEDIVQNSFLLTKSENNFNETLKVGNVDYILKLQNQLKNNQIEISQLTDNELDEVIELYKKQIADKKIKLKQYRTKINNI